MATLAREALEGERALSDLLGGAIQQLRRACARIEALEGELAAASAPRAPTLALLPSSGASAATAPAARGGLDVDVPRHLKLTDAQPADGFDLLGSRLPDRPDALESLLRARLAAALFLGVVSPGDRLPGIRDVARRTGMNHKTVRRAYTALEASGRIEVRDRSGIYVAEQRPHAPGVPLTELEGWFAAVLASAGELGIRPGELPRRLEEHTAPRTLRCACVAAVDDDRFALVTEIAGRFGIRTYGVRGGRAELADALAGADLVVTTEFHADDVRPALLPSQPMVVVDPHPDLRSMLRQASGAGAVVLCVDPAFGERLAHGFDGMKLPEFRAVGRGDAVRSATRTAGAAFATLAASHHLGGAPSPGLMVPRYLSAASISQLAQLVVGLNRAAA